MISQLWVQILNDEIDTGAGAAYIFGRDVGDLIIGVLGSSFATSL